MLIQLRNIVNSLHSSKNLPKGTLLAEFKISGMHCPSCSLNIDSSLEDLPGVIEASTSYAKGVTKVYYDPNQIQLKELTECINQTGYQVA